MSVHEDQEKIAEPPRSEAIRFLRTYYQEQNRSAEELENRIAQVSTAVSSGRSFQPTTEELAGACRMAWRNSTRCIGRIYWKSLHLFDHRDLVRTDDIFQALLAHLTYSTNGGNIRSAISVFAPGVTIWNDQLIRYAGYRQADGTVVGDPDSVSFTDICIALGWKGRGGRFDVLPLVVQVGEQPPVWMDIPASHILRVPIRHPEYAFFEELALEWYALPAIANMELHFGGRIFGAVPFSGWYMGTEIGARNLADPHRYNMLPAVAEKLGLDTRHASSLWKDRALLELNRAVLFSFQQAGVKILDHHTASDLFLAFERAEHKQGRSVKGEWSWLVPPVAGATSGIFHREYDNREVTPNFFYRAAPPWKSAAHGTARLPDDRPSCPFHRESGGGSSYRELQ